MKSLNIDRYPEDYRSARNAFLDAADAAGVGATSRVHPDATGRDGRPLFMDTVTLGRRDAKQALLVISGTGGVDGYFGSAVQTALLVAGPVVPENTRLVFLHAFNPWGFAWSRSVNENNVRLDRNFVCFDPPPENPLYAEVADALCVPDMAPETLAAADASLAAFAERHGESALQAILLSGQYVDPQGLFYGGNAPSWSREMLADIFREELRGANSVVALDLRTGFGAFGRSVLISGDAPESAGYALARDIWQGAHLEYAGAGPQGQFARPGSGIGQMIADYFARGVQMTLMAGTRPFGEILSVLRRDNWCFRKGLDNVATARIADEVRTMYCPDSKVWVTAAVQAAGMAIQTALAAMSAE